MVGETVSGESAIVILDTRVSVMLSALPCDNASDLFEINESVSQNHARILK